MGKRRGSLQEAQAFPKSFPLLPGGRDWVLFVSFLHLMIERFRETGILSGTFAMARRCFFHVTMNTNQSLNSRGSHIAWVDFLRILACFLVVLAHCCDPFVGSFDGSFNFKSAVFWGSLVRPCVPLFAMISGVLLFPVTLEMGAFYSRRLKRVLVPLIVWSLALPLLYFGYFAAGVQTDSPNIVMDTYTWSATVGKLYTFFFNFNYDTTPLWYVYMLVGLYLFMPIMSAWLTQARRKDVKIFLGIWIFSMTLPYIQMLAPALGYEGNYGNMGILGVCDWNPYGMFYNFSGFLGYMVLAHYLTKYPLAWSWKKMLSITIPLFLIGFAVTFFGFLETQKHFPGQYSKLEVLWYFSGINVFLMTFAIFAVVSRLRIKAGPVLSKVAALTFGVYLCHFFFVQCSYDFVNFIGLGGLPSAVKIPLMACLASAVSAALVWLLSLNRWTRKSIM